MFAGDRFAGGATVFSVRQAGTENPLAPPPPLRVSLALPPMKKWRLLGPFATGGVAVALFVLSLGQVREGASNEAPERSGDPVDTTSLDAGPQAVGKGSEQARPAADRHAIAVLDHEGEDDLSQRWDELPPAQRVAELHRQFRRGVEGMQRGDGEGSSSHSDAVAALTGLRAELYGSEEGRRQHEALERELDESLALGRDRRDESRPAR